MRCNEIKMPARCSGGYFIEPTVIEGLDYKCRTQQEEIFGPVVPYSFQLGRGSINDG